MTCMQIYKLLHIKPGGTLCGSFWFLIGCTKARMEPFGRFHPYCWLQGLNLSRATSNCASLLRL